MVDSYAPLQRSLAAQRHSAHLRLSRNTSTLCTQENNSLVRSAHFTPTCRGCATRAQGVYLTGEYRYLILLTTSFAPTLPGVKPDSIAYPIIIMNKPSTAVLKAPSGTSTPCPTTEEPQRTKYDNFYTPQNSEFYSKFGYMSLNPEERRIRLLRIQQLEPGEDKRSRIKYELIDNQSLAAMQGKFTTISYCAGDPKKIETIIVNGLEFNAFSNLGHALRQVRHFWKEKFDTQELLLWADQVCINQSNPNERSHQVKFMGDIYGSAIQVLACLSVEGDRSGGIRGLQQFSSEFQEYEQSQPDLVYACFGISSHIYGLHLTMHRACLSKMCLFKWHMML